MSMNSFFRCFKNNNLIMMSLLKEKVLKLPELEDMTPETLITI
jgi:hypothetical protein